MTSRGTASVLDLIGQTPLLRLQAIERDTPGVELHAKAEWFNPGGSVKDRPAARMILEGERSGALRHDRVILDATSGNTGIAYAMIGASRGYCVRLCVPGNVTPERQRILRALGVDLVITSALEGSDGAIREARRLYAEHADIYFYPNQYGNDANWRAHYDTTGPEIIRQTRGRLTHFVAGLGTSGTFVGTGRRLRDYARRRGGRIRLVSVQPDSPMHGLEGLKHMTSAIVPGIYDPSLADEDRRVSTETAYAMVRRLAAEEGLLVGISGGAAVAACVELAREIEHGVIVTVLPDSGVKYLSESFWGAPDATRPGRVED
jgi:cysteine synthase B